MTNAERIRQMTDKELVSFFARDYCPPSQPIEPHCTARHGRGKCNQCWRKWLKSDNPDESDAVDRSDECKE